MQPSIYKNIFTWITSDALMYARTFQNSFLDGDNGPFPHLALVSAFLKTKKDVVPHTMGVLRQ